MAKAVSLFHGHHADPSTGKPMTIRKLCKLVSDEHFANVQAHEARDALKDAASRRKDAKSKYAEALEVWKVREMDRKERNAAWKLVWTEDVKRWEDEKKRAKSERRKPGWTKPKMPIMEKALRRPKVADFVEESADSEEIEGEQDEEDYSGSGDDSDGNDSD